MQSRWERREQKKRAERQRMPKHGRNIGTIYQNCWRKRNTKRNQERRPLDKEQE